jgi:hypothetical protein
MESRLLKGRLLEVRERKEMDRMRKAMKEWRERGSRKAGQDEWIGGLHEKENRKKIKRRGGGVQSSDEWDQWERDYQLHWGHLVMTSYKNWSHCEAVHLVPRFVFIEGIPRKLLLIPVWNFDVIKRSPFPI